MKVAGKVCVVTGGASGIGAALCRRFSSEGAAGLVVVDRDAEGARAVAEEVGGYAVVCDLRVEQQVTAMVAAATDRYGRVDLLCSNAGIVDEPDDFLAGPIEPWHQQWAINVMSHVHAVRAVLPQMLERGEGHIQHTASMAGILNGPGAPVYVATKHALVGFAEWLAITYGSKGIHVYLLCPLGVATPLLDVAPSALRAASGSASTPQQVAQNVIDGFDAERFLIYTDPDAATWVQRKYTDPDRWLAGMQRIGGGHG